MDPPESFRHRPVRSRPGRAETADREVGAHRERENYGPSRPAHRESRPARARLRLAPGEAVDDVRL